MTGFQLPVPPCAHQALLELKAASTKSGSELKGEENTNTQTPKRGCLLLLGWSCFHKEQQPLPCNGTAAPIPDISQELKG